MKVVFVCPDLADNSLGRAYALWCLAEHLGWSARVVGQSSTGGVWAPLSGHAFERICRPKGRRLTVRDVRRESAGADIVVIVKAVPSSFGVVHRARELLGVPILLDVDDDDLGHWLDHLGPWQRRGFLHPKHVLRRSLPHQLERLRSLTSQVPLTVSNPLLQARYGGVVVPHVRIPETPSAPPTSRPPTVGFLGTPRAHKGLEALRTAVSEARRSAPWELMITATPPGDARSWERWIGNVPISRLTDVMASLDVVAVPSNDSDFSRHQLPVKIIDGMLALRPILASDLPVIRWATNGHAELVAAGRVATLSEGLTRLEDADHRAALAGQARTWALQAFTPDAVAPRLADAVHQAISS